MKIKVIGKKEENDETFEIFSKFQVKGPFRFQDHEHCYYCDKENAKESYKLKHNEVLTMLRYCNKECLILFLQNVETIKLKVKPENTSSVALFKSKKCVKLEKRNKREKMVNNENVLPTKGTSGKPVNIINNKRPTNKPGIPLQSSQIPANKRTTIITTKRPTTKPMATKPEEMINARIAPIHTQLNTNTPKLTTLEMMSSKRVTKRATVKPNTNDEKVPQPKKQIKLVYDDSSSGVSSSSSASGASVRQLTKPQSQVPIKSQFPIKSQPIKSQIALTIKSQPTKSQVTSSQVVPISTSKVVPTSTSQVVPTSTSQVGTTSTSKSQVPSPAQNVKKPQSDYFEYLQDLYDKKKIGSASVI